MRATTYYAPTLRQAPAEAETASHRLLLRGGFIRQVAGGALAFLPMGLRVLRKVSDVVREEMNEAGALELLMPLAEPAEPRESGGRQTPRGPDPHRAKDCFARAGLPAPAHGETLTRMVALDVASYRDLPVRLYQIQRDLGDESRPRAGLLRARTGVTMSAHSFDADLSDLDTSFGAIHDALVRVFRRLGLDALVAEGESGSADGVSAREFVAPLSGGDDTIVRCGTCDYAANAQCARSRTVAAAPTATTASSPEPVETPNARTVEAVCDLLHKPPTQLVKTMIYQAVEGCVAALVRGDRRLSEAKLKRALGTDEVTMAEAEVVRALTGAEVGFSGPVGLPKHVTIIADDEVRGMVDCVVGANQTDAHLVHVDEGRDFSPRSFADLREAGQGDGCPECDHGVLEVVQGIRLAREIRIGSSDSGTLDARFADEHGERRPLAVGHYELGVSCCIAALVEQQHDEAGIAWPREVAPFEVAVLLLDPGIGALSDAAEALYQDLEAQQWEVLLDDRDVRPGAKFKDVDLIGYPVTVVVGNRLLREGLVEVRRRRDRAEAVVGADQVVAAVQELLADA